MDQEQTVHYKLRISVDLPEGVPLVWRELETRGETSLAELHKAFQEAFGWTGLHKHEFVASDKSWKATDPQYGPPEFDESYKNEQELTLESVAPKQGPAFSWNYDITDPWIHHVEVSSVSQAAGPVTTKLTGGQRAAIPEEVGGASGYLDFLQSLDPSDPEHNAMAVWYKTDCPNGGGKYDPERIDFDKINQKLASWTPKP